MPDDLIVKSEEEWQQQLTPEQYRVMRGKETEAPFTGKYYNSKENGMYVCAACGNELFASDAKFDSGTGWPSYSAPASDKNVGMKADMSLGVERTEVVCNRCGAHLGHVFDDLPAGRQAAIPPGVKRYCINSCALDLKKESSKDKKWGKFVFLSKNFFK